MLQARPDRSGKQEQEKKFAKFLKGIVRGSPEAGFSKGGADSLHSSTTYLIPDNAFLWEEWGQGEEEERGELVWDVERLQIFL